MFSKHFLFLLSLVCICACKKSVSTEGNTFVTYHGEGYGNEEAHTLATEANQLLEQGKTESARELLEESLELEVNKYTYNSLGLADQLDSNYVSAIAYFEKALSIDSSYIDAKLNLARTYAENKNPMMGIKLNLEVIADDADPFKTGVAHLHVARIYGSIDSCDAANAHNDQAKIMLVGEEITKEQMERNDRWLEQRCNSAEAKIVRWIQENPERGEIHRPRR